MKLEQLIPVGKCIGCKMGLETFIEDKDRILHLDLFATPEAGAMYECTNTDAIRKYVSGNPNRIFSLSNELREPFKEQGNWWADMVNLAHEIFNSDEKVANFFNQKVEEDMMWQRFNAEIEEKLLEEAGKAGVEVKGEDYEDLIKFKTEEVKNE